MMIIVSIYYICHGTSSLATASSVMRSPKDTYVGLGFPKEGHLIVWTLSEAQWHEEAQPKAKPQPKRGIKRPAAARAEVDG